MVRKQLEKSPEMAGILKGIIADAWIRKAREEGLEKGLEEGLEAGEMKEKLILRFEEKVALLSKLVEKRFDAGVIADLSSLSTVFVQDFISGYNQESLQRRLQSIELARQTKEPEAAADILRQWMATYGWSKESMEDYFTAMG
jgi:flagellar biosynthesis/type III secretory pathway M-ring protein FliF/YscJ